jgi:hypothetical protein
MPINLTDLCGDKLAQLKFNKLESSLNQTINPHFYPRAGSSHLDSLGLPVPTKQHSSGVKFLRNTRPLLDILSSANDPKSSVTAPNLQRKLNEPQRDEILTLGHTGNKKQTPRKFVCPRPCPNHTPPSSNVNIPMAAM